MSIMWSMRLGKMKFSLIASMLLINLFMMGQAQAWTVNATWEKFAAGTATGGDQNIGLGDGLWISNSRESVVATPVHSGQKSLRIHLPGGTEDTWQNDFRLPTSITEGGQIWARFYVYVPTGFDWTSNPITKLFRLAVVDGSGGQAGYISILISRPSNYSCAGSPNDFGYIVGGEEILSASGFVCQNKNTAQLNFLAPGAWHALELYAKASANGAGILRIWHNGELIWEKTGLNNIPAGGAIYAGDGNYTGHFMGWWNGGVPKDQDLYFDDFRYTNDTPTKVDAAGNFMIGTLGSVMLAAPSAPKINPLVQ